MITVVIVLAVVVLIVAGVLLAARSTFAARARAVQESWRHVDAALGRRHALIADLTTTVTATTRFDQDALDRLATARAQAIAMRGQGPVMQSQAEQQLGAAVNRLFQAAEGFAEVKSNPDFRFLAEAMTECEDRIAAGRRFYNTTAATYNAGFTTLPERVMSGNYRKADYFQPDEPIGPSPYPAPTGKLTWSWAWLSGSLSGSGSGSAAGAPKPARQPVPRSPQR